MDNNPEQAAEASAEQLPLHQQPTTQATITKMVRTTQVPQRLITAKRSVVGETQDAFFKGLHKEEYSEQQQMNNPILYITTAQQKKDTIYFHQAMQQDDIE